LVKRIKGAPNRDLSAILIDVRNDVMAATRNRQVPWEHSALRARFFFAPPAPSAQKAATRDASAAPATARSTQLYDSLMRRILAQKLKGAITPGDEGKDNYYKAASTKSPKAMAVCIDWEKSTPHRLEHRGISFASGEKAQIDADERALSQCYRVASGCQCTIVDRNDANAIVFPAVWLARHRGALQ
jgi:hypothetical protein